MNPAVHDRWLNSVILILGYVWLISGLDKILSNQFVSGFSGYVTTQISHTAVLPWYRLVLSAAVLPNSAFFATLIEFSELALGIVLILGGLVNIIRESRLVHVFLALASLGSFFMISSIILAQGSSFPFINTDSIFEEGVSLDFVVLFISISLALANAREAVREWRSPRQPDPVPTGPQGLSGEPNQS